MRFSKTRAGMTVVALAVAALPVQFAVAASTDPNNRAPVSSSTVSSWSPARTWTTTSDPNNCSSLTFPDGTDIYHFVVQSERGDNGLTGRNKKSWTYSADFTQGGSAVVEYSDEPGTQYKIARGTFGLGTIQDDHLYVAVPRGRTIAKAWLNYAVAVSGDSAFAPAITTIDGNHNLSHSCASPAPTISIETKTATYTEQWDERYSWSVEKSLVLGDGETAKEKYYDTGSKPEFSVAATRSANPDEENWRVVEGTQQVTGTFTVTNATGADATFSIDDDNSTDVATCSISDDSVPNDSRWVYTCTWDSETSVSGENGLSGLGYTISATVTNTAGSGTAETSGSFGNQSATSGLAGTFDETASLSDDLAGFGGSVSSCTGCTGSVEDGTLAVDEASGSFTVTYTVDWDWTAYETAAECGADFTNTATLSVWETAEDSTPTELTDNYVSDPNCPPPTVEITDVTSTYDVEYDQQYSWTIAKRSLGQDEENLRAAYEVTATRSGPTVVDESIGIVDGEATITGTFTTTFADPSVVVVTVSYGGTDHACTTGEGTFSCTITGLDTDDEVNGLDGSDYTVTATVSTAGGDDDSSVDDELGTPADSKVTDLDASASITDDLGGYKAVGVVCATGTGADCWVNSSTEVAAGSTLSTSESEDSITLTYELDWLADADTSAACPTIENTAGVVSGDETLATAGTSEEMTCPVPVVTLASAPQYDQQWDESYGWEITKTYKGQDPATWKPLYEVTATRDASSTFVDGSHAVVDGSQKVTGSFTLSVDPNVFTATLDNTDVEITLDGAACTIDGGKDGVYDYTCEVTDESDVDGPNGLASANYSVAATATVFLTDSSGSHGGSWGNQGAGSGVKDLFNDNGWVVDSLAAVNGGTVSTANASVVDNVLVSNSTASTITVRYSGNWDWSKAGACGQSITNVADVWNDDDEVLDSATTTNTMVCLKQSGGLTIGFWGNKAGGSEVVRKRGEWRTGGPWATLLGARLPNFTSDSQVRDYMNKANCSGDCKTMFLAQSLATVMNHLRSADYANQWVMFRGVCSKVRNLMDIALGSNVIVDGTGAAGLSTRIAYKSIFDDLNNNRATRCPGS